MASLKLLTEVYIMAFNNNDLVGIADLMDDSFVLTDPNVRKLGPKDKVLEYLQKLFDGCKLLDFNARVILVDAPYTLVHFTLGLNETTYDGVDIIFWSEGKMQSIDAYLTART